MKTWQTTVLAAATAIAGLGGGWVMGRNAPPEPPKAEMASPDASSGGAEAIRSANAARPGSKKVSGMQFLSLRPDFSGDQPVACLEFSKPLSTDAKVRWADYIDIQPASPFVATPRESALCLSGLGFSPDRKTTIKAGLPAADGDVTKRSEEFTIAFGDQPAFVGFPGSGVILPRSQADGVGISTVNVSTLKVEVKRVSDRILPTAEEIAEGQSVAEGAWSYFGDTEASETARPIWTGTVDVKNVRNQRITSVFPLGAAIPDRAPGVYVIKVTDVSAGAGGKSPDEEDTAAAALRWVVYTDMAVTTFRGAGLDAVIRDLDSGKPVSGIQTRLMAANADELGRATTDNNGRARFEPALLNGEGPLEPRYLFAYGKNGDFAVHDLRRPAMDLSDKGIGGRTALGVADGFVYTDRGIYRPGEMVRLVALARDRAAKPLKKRPGAIVLYRPNGTEAFRQRLTTSDQGDAGIDLALDRASPRGQWRIALLVDGIKEEIGDARFAVEDFVPQRLEVAASAVGGPLRVESPVSLAVKARFLYGAVGSGLTVQGDGRLSVDPNPFPQWKDFRFGREEELFEERLLEFESTVSDGAGLANLSLALPDVGETTKMLRAEAVVSVVEPGGRAVRERVAVPVRLRDLAIGIRPRFDYAVTSGQDSAFDVVALNTAGQAVAAQNLSVSIVQEDWNWDWYQEDGEWSYRRSSRDIPMSRSTLSTNVGKATLFAKRLEDGWYRLVVTDAATGATSSVRFSVGWGGTGERDTPDSVTVSVPEKPVKSGQDVAVTIRSPYDGTAQIVVANDNILEIRTVDVKASGTTVRVKSSDDWGGGAYVMVSVVTKRDAGNQPVPRRALGIAYAGLDSGARTLSVSIGGAPKITPRQSITVPVKIANASFGSTVRVTLSAVDEGILRLTKFTTPDPVGHYFGKRALGIELRDDYGRLLDPNMGAAAALKQGGDSLGGEGLTVVPTKSVALFSGIVTVGFGGTANIKLDVPDFNGELRLMAVAWSDDALGSSSRPITVRDPVVADLTLPRFMAPGDQVSATLLLDNVEGKAGDYQAVVTGGGALAALAPPTLSTTLSQGGRSLLSVPIAAAQAGVGEVKLAITGPGGFAVSRSYSIQVRPGELPVTVAETSPQAAGERFVAQTSLLAGFSAGSSVSISYSSLRGIDAKALTEALSRYPYGCTEQTVSGAMPYVYKNTIATEAKSALDPKAAPIVQKAVNTILDRMSPDGTIGMWREGDNSASPWLGAYASDFLLRAKAAGAAVPEEAIDRAVKALKEVTRLSEWTNTTYNMTSSGALGDSDALVRSRGGAYALYVLARAGRTDLGPVRYFADNQMSKEPSPMAKAQIGAALAALGDRARANAAFRDAESALGYVNPGDWYQSKTRDLAAVLALAVEANQLPLANRLAGRLAQEAGPASTLNTQEQAQMVLAANALASRAGLLRIGVAGAAAVEERGSLAFPAPYAELSKGMAFLNAGTGTVWRTVLISGSPSTPPPALSAGMNLSRSITALDGSAVSMADLKQGDRVLVRLSASTSGGRIIQSVLIDPLPAGLEIETVLTANDGSNADGGGTGPFGWIGRILDADIAEARDDRFVASFTARQEAQTVAYIARAVTPGSYAQPGAQIEDMYRPGVFARTGAGRMSVLSGT